MAYCRGPRRVTDHALRDCRHKRHEHGDRAAQAALAQTQPEPRRLDWLSCRRARPACPCARLRCRPQRNSPVIPVSIVRLTDETTSPEQPRQAVVPRQTPRRRPPPRQSPPLSHQRTRVRRLMISKLKLRTLADLRQPPLDQDLARTVRRSVAPERDAGRRRARQRSRNQGLSARPDRTPLESGPRDVARAQHHRSAARRDHQGRHHNPRGASRRPPGRPRCGL